MEAQDEATQAKNNGTASVLEGASVLEVVQEDETSDDRAMSRKTLETAATKGAKEGMKAEMYYILNNHVFNVFGHVHEVLQMTDKTCDMHIKSTSHQDNCIYEKVIFFDVHEKHSHI